MKTLREAYGYAVDRLSAAGIEDAAYDARIILEAISGISYDRLVINPHMPCDEVIGEKLKKLLDERVGGRPLQYIIGQWDFMGLTFKVGEGVLIPRPETEALVEYTVEKLKNADSPVIFDLCSGSGCIGLSVKKLLPSAQVYLIEKSKDALGYLIQNRDSLGLSESVVAIEGDILKGYTSFPDLPVPDVILSNPPYIKRDEIATLQTEVQREPDMALDGGEDGFDFYRSLAADWLPYIRDGGYMAVECGEGQAVDIGKMMEPYCERTEILNDFSHIQRIVVGIKRTNKGE